LKPIFYWVDHTARCNVNSGVQRVARGLGRGLLASGAPVVPVVWISRSSGIRSANGSELRHLARWNGPVFPSRRSTGFIKQWLIPRRQESIHENIEYARELNGAWLLVPEVTHMTAHSSPATTALIQYARAHGMRVAFIFFDALPLKYEIYREMRAVHAQYMRALVHADCIIPISRTSAEELRRFVASEQLKGIASIAPCALPAEFPGVPRVSQVKTAKPTLLDILCVGSFDSRKNQATLLSAFQALAGKHPSAPWRLTFAGNFAHEVASLVAGAIHDPKIRFIGAPTDEQVAALYRACYFTVFPSIDEGFGLPIVESIWFAKPCLCANFGAMREAADGGGCVLVDMRSAEELSQGLELLLTDHQRVIELQEEAIRRPLDTWANYARKVNDRLQAAAARVSQ
jgi:glycosyltransferase involved in cell wall biosynthesis